MIGNSSLENLAFEAFYPHSPERVWQALTDPAALARWLLPTDFQPRIGFRFRFEGGRKDAVKGEVLDAVPGQRLAYTWVDEDDDGAAGTPSVVTWTLEPKPGGTKVRLEHQLVHAVATTERHAMLIEAEANWGYALHGAIPIVLDGWLQTRHPIVPIAQVWPVLERRFGFSLRLLSCRRPRSQARLLKRGQGLRTLKSLCDNSCTGLHRYSLGKPYSLPFRRGKARRAIVPIVYMADEPEPESPRRAGFRQEEEPCRC